MLLRLESPVSVSSLNDSDNKDVSLLPRYTVTDCWLQAACHASLCIAFRKPQYSVPLPGRLLRTAVY